MNKLFHVIAYSHRQNQYARHLVTATDVHDAERQMRDYYDDTDYRVKRTSFICETPADIFMEV